MLKKKKIMTILACCAMCAILFAGCGNHSEQNGKNTSAKAAKGEISLYTSQPEADAQKLIAAFNKKYPDVKVKIFRSGTEEVISKVMAEKKLGKVQADVLLVSDAATFEQLKNKDILEKYASPELEAIPSSFVDKDHTYAGTKVIATGIMYNVNKIKTPPKSFMDLTKADYKDQTSMPSPLYSGAAAYNLSLFTRTNGLGWDFYQGLKNNGVKVDKGNGSVLKDVTDGARNIGMIVDYMAFRAKAKGAPVEFVYPDEGVPFVTEPIGIVKGSANENLAKLFEDFILSVDGQKETAAIGYTPVRKGVAAPKGFASIEKMKIITGDLPVLVKAREEDKQKFTTMFK